MTLGHLAVVLGLHLLRPCLDRGIILALGDPGVECQFDLSVPVAVLELGKRQEVGLRDWTNARREERLVLERR